MSTVIVRNESAVPGLGMTYLVEPLFVLVGCAHTVKQGLKETLETMGFTSVSYLCSLK
jgi:hypothetical protein